MSRHKILVCLSALIAACGGYPLKPEYGELSLALSAEAGGKAYRLTAGSFSLEGPTTRQFSVEDEDRMQLSVTPGSYTLSLADGWVLSRVDGDTLEPVAASLESQNPAQLVVGAGATTQVMLRFALADGNALDPAQGKLEIGVALDEESSDGSAGSVDPCVNGLVVNEIDYEQVGVDGAEFVEVLNTAGCAATLRAVTLELVNGGDSKAYGRINLELAGEALSPGGRLVVGHSSTLAALPPSVLALKLGSSGLQNGPSDTVRIVAGDVLVDAILYGGEVSGVDLGTQAPSDDGHGSLSRCPDGFDAGDNSHDFRLVAPTPGTPNACP